MSVVGDDKSEALDCRTVFGEDPMAKTQQPLTGTLQIQRQENDDDSIIKCICGFQHDDGNSVFCDRCNTWQHTECYYYNSSQGRVPDGAELESITHLCTDCCPQVLDIHAAINRQRDKMETMDHATDSTKHQPISKARRTAASKDNSSHNSGVTHRKSAHIAPLRGRPPGQDEETKAHSPTLIHPSTRTTRPSPRAQGSYQSYPPENPGILPGPYSPTFLRLFDTDASNESMQTNLYNDISITEKLSQWAYDAHALQAATRGFSHADVFHRMDRPLAQMIGPSPRKCYAEDDNTIVNERHPRWIYLVSDHHTRAKTIVGELKGKIGHMNDYIQASTNRWDYLRHPAPFVFFHPRLPIYIDTRDEGTPCRFLRRSCRPNLTMTTFLENESEYHFCFTAKEDIPAGSELTIGWVPDEHIRKFGMIKDDASQGANTGGEAYIRDWVGRVLPEFGGCACGSPENCWLATRIDVPGMSDSKPHGGLLASNLAISEDSVLARPSIRRPSSTDQIESWAKNPSPKTSEVLGSAKTLAANEIHKEHVFSDNDLRPPKKQKRASDGPRLNDALSTSARLSSDGQSSLDVSSSPHSGPIEQRTRVVDTSVVMGEYSPDVSEQCMDAPDSSKPRRSQSLGRTDRSSDLRHITSFDTGTQTEDEVLELVGHDCQRVLKASWTLKLLRRSRRDRRVTLALAERTPAKLQRGAISIVMENSFDGKRDIRSENRNTSETSLREDMLDNSRARRIEIAMREDQTGAREQIAMEVAIAPAINSVTPIPIAWPKKAPDRPSSEMNADMHPSSSRHSMHASPIKKRVSLSDYIRRQGSQS